MDLDDVMLWDLLMIGDDMSCGAHHIYVGKEPAEYRYCMIHSASVLYWSSTFLEGMVYTLNEIREGHEEFERLEK